MSPLARARGAIPTAALIGLAVSACHIGFGPTPETFVPAQHPAGVHATLRLPDRTIEGELLEVRDTTLLLLTTPDRRIASVPISAIEAGEFAQARERIVRGGFRSDLDRMAIRRLSRFPAGLSAASFAALLEAHGQTAPDAFP